MHEEAVPDLKFKVAIVGAGAISHTAHVPAVLASPLAELAAVVDPDAQRARGLCEAYGIHPEIAADIAELGADIDGAIVGAPNDLHASIATVLVNRGIPVLVEKPVATDVAAANALSVLASARGVTVAVGYHTRQSGACRVLKYAVESEHFGRTIRFAHQDGSRGGWSPLSGYNLDTQRAGGGVLVTTGTHFLDRLIWLWGTPTAVSLRDNAAGGPESHCVARFAFGSGNTAISGAAFFSKVIGLPEMTVVETTEGLLIMPSDAAETITFRPRRDPNLEYEVRLPGHRHDPRSLYQREFEDFVAACRTGSKPCVDAATGTQSVELLQRLYAARQPLFNATETSMGESFHV